MLKNILVGTALTLVAASTSFTPAIAKAIPHNYAEDSILINTWICLGIRAPLVIPQAPDQR